MNMAARGVRMAALLYALILGLVNLGNCALDGEVTLEDFEHACFLSENVSPELNVLCDRIRGKTRSKQVYDCSI